MTDRLITSAAAVVGFVLATGPLGEGGRHTDVLLLHQSVLGAAAIGMMLLGPDCLRGRRLSSCLLLALAAVWYVGSPNRYVTVLCLGDIATAFLVYVLATAGSVSSIGRRFILSGLLCGATINILSTHRTSGGHLGGLFPNPHHGAALAAAVATMMLVAPVGLGGGMGRIVRGGIWLAALAYISVLRSRGGAVALLAGVVAVAIVKGYRRYLALLPLALLLFYLVPSPLSRRLHQGAQVDRYAFERVHIWSQALRMGRDHFMQGGAGLGSFPSVALRYNFPVEGGLSRFGKYPNTAHSDYLSLWAETGVAGLALLIVPCVVVGRRARRSVQVETEVQAYRLGGIAGATAILAHSGVEVVLQSPGVLYTFAALLGLVGGPPPTGEPREGRTSPPVLAILVLAAMWGQGSFLPWLGDRYFSRFQRTGEAADLRRAIAVVPTHSGYQRRAGDEAGARFLAGHDLNDLSEAEWRYREATRLDRVGARAWAAWAGFEHRAFVSSEGRALELAERAIGHYQEASLRDPFNPFLLHEKARLLRSMGRADDALQEVTHAVRLEPNFYLGWKLVLELRRERGDRSGTLEAANDLVRTEQLAASAKPAGDYERRLLAKSEGTE